MTDALAGRGTSTGSTDPGARQALFPTYRVLAQWVTFAVLAVAVLVTGGLSLAGKKLSYGPAENRTLARLPPPTVANLLDRGHFAKINTWAGDHQALRSPLIALNSGIKLKVFGTTLDSQTIVGQDGFYFYGIQFMIRDFTRQTRIEQDPDYLRGLLAYFRSLDAWAKSTGRIVLIAVTPNKHNVYPEFFSDAHRFGGGPAAGEKLDAWLSRHLPDMVVPMTAPLRTAKEAGQQVYYRTDTHWSPIGAKIGTDAILEKVRHRAPRLSFPRPLEYRLRQHVRKNGNFARLLGLPLTETMSVPALDSAPRAIRDKEFYRGIVPKLLPKKPRHLRLYEVDDAAANARVLVIGDSFMSYIFRYLSEAVSKSVFYNPWGYGSDPDLRFPRTLIDRLDPQVVVIQLVERRIRPCAGWKDDEKTSCQGTLVPRLPAFAATPRLTDLFAAGSAMAAKVALEARSLTIGLDQPVPQGHLAIARLRLANGGAAALKPAGRLAPDLQYELTEAELSETERTSILVLNLDKKRTAASLKASRALAPGEIEVEVRIVPDDVDMVLPDAGRPGDGRSAARG